MKNKESVNAHMITGTRDNNDRAKAVAESDISVDILDEKDLLVTKDEENYHVNIGGGILELQITNNVAHSLGRKLLEGARAV